MEERSSVVLPIVFGIVCLVGTVGNCIVIYTITRKPKRNRNTADVFIVSLSITDLLFLLGMPFLIHQLLGNGVWLFGATMCTIITALDANSQFASTYILTAMSIDRYLATVRPIRSAYMRTPCTAAVVIFLLYLLSLLTSVPVFMYSQPIALPGSRAGCGIILPNLSVDIYWYTLYQFFLAFIIPLLVICIVYLKIQKHISRVVLPLPQRNFRARTKKIMRIAVTICSAFFVCWAPYYILQLVHLEVTQPTTAFLYAYNVAISLGYASSCINPFIYIVLSDTFQRKLVKAICPGRPARRGKRRPAGKVSPSVKLNSGPHQETSLSLTYSRNTGSYLTVSVP
ncbi:PREDICTED: melanin-concentrating hormone receptor 1-like [Crocodylus porosus]|uniref:melanin-concentrating hormone receptor 1-like n=1 Tax=Crocodylus porosus TaxID=8502 RepID=UPI00093F14C6|nr:PREDICTED: melanin-concentrating hormone receptor 1-like [Crocodylus porosus]